MAGACAMRSIYASNSIIQSSKSDLRSQLLRYCVDDLMTDIGTMTAIGNDIDFTRVFLNPRSTIHDPRTIGVG
jgi:hypothetical protein